AGAIGYQRFALFTGTDDAVLAFLVVHLRLIRVTTQAFDLSRRQRRQLGAGKAVNLEDQAPGQRVADLPPFRLRVPGFRQAQSTCRQPGRVSRVVGRFGFDLQGNVRRLDPGDLAGSRSEGQEIVVARAVDQGGTEGLSGDHQLATALQIDGVLQLDYAVQHSADAFLVGAWFAQLFGPCILYAQRRQVAVVIHGHRVVDAQGQHGLGLHVHAFLIEAGV